MIAPGTLCLLLAPHTLAGRTCTAANQLGIGAPIFAPERRVVEATDECYEILVDAPLPELCIGWYAFRSELVPIAPPGHVIDTFTDEPALV